ncbi:homeobox protein HD1-like isoform X3 [Salvia miltiorrhiza]|uniref:homeobox protein HD1-like isoform X3 n=1 Tax=Salvia miltiorrhiza TaxID=226208 RepID=UPI0025AC9F3A|nr:homeobox protein HD1-like isoform X3 [Salvia miltiorrhiza]
MANSGQQLKAEIAGHPLCEQLVAAHVACLRVATPIDELPNIEAQLCESQHLLRSYAQTATHSLSKHQSQQLETLLRQYVLALWSLKEQLHQHVNRCREIEHTFISLTGNALYPQSFFHQLAFHPNSLGAGARVGEGSGATMWEDDEEHSERALVERVRKKLKIELKEGFKSRIQQVRDEISRKRRSGKLADDTTDILKNWWHHHSNWPYPTMRRQILWNGQAWS